MSYIIIMLITISSNHSIITIPGFKSMEGCETARSFIEYKIGDDYVINNTRCLEIPNPDPYIRK